MVVGGGGRKQNVNITGADRLPEQRCAMRLRAVLDHGDSMSPWPTQQSRRKIRGRAIQVYDDDGLRGFPAISGKRSFQAGGIHRVAPRIDVHEKRVRADPSYCRRGRDSRVRDCQDAVAGTNAERSQGQFNGVRAIGDTDCPPHSHCSGELFFECFNFLAKDVPVAFQYAFDGNVDCVPVRPIARAGLD